MHSCLKCPCLPNSTHFRYSVNLLQVISFVHQHINPTTVRYCSNNPQSYRPELSLWRTKKFGEHFSSVAAQDVGHRLVSWQSYDNYFPTLTHCGAKKLFRDFTVEGNEAHCKESRTLLYKYAPSKATASPTQTLQELMANPRQVLIDPPSVMSSMPFSCARRWP
jgi:hypothetical protein